MVSYGFVIFVGICLVIITGLMSGSSEDADKDIKIRRSSYLDGPSSGVL